MRADSARRGPHPQPVCDSCHAVGRLHPAVGFAVRDAMDAVDVAFTEAAVGAGISTVSDARHAGPDLAP